VIEGLITEEKGYGLGSKGLGGGTKAPIEVKESSQTWGSFSLGPSDVIKARDNDSEIEVWKRIRSFAAMPRMGS